jgi:hypothetical protein
LMGMPLGVSPIINILLLVFIIILVAKKGTEVPFLYYINPKIMH